MSASEINYHEEKNLYQKLIINRTWDNCIWSAANGHHRGTRGTFLCVQFRKETGKSNTPKLKNHHLQCVVWIYYDPGKKRGLDCMDE
jgi:hypothetical protein